MNWPLLLTAAFFLLGPLLMSLVDVIPARRGRAHTAIPTHVDVLEDDFEIVVPIWGHTRFLENVEFLAQYGNRVTLATTSVESVEFYRQLDLMAEMHGFRVFRAEVPVTGDSRGSERAVSGTIRDRVVREAMHSIRARYVVCVDADTVPSRPIEELVGALAANDLEIASVRIVPSNTDTLVGKFQAIEYRLTMRLRRLWPWLVSGACHAGTTAAYTDVMDNHSLFFQGNDAEVGLLATKLGYRVGHVDYEVPTTVPDTWRAWWRQRFAWSGGEFRLGIVNFPIVAKLFPMFAAYLTGIVLLLSVVRWFALTNSTLAVLAVLAAIYVGLVVWSERRFSLSALLYPLYGMFGSLVLAILSPVSYAVMAVRDRNTGRIGTDRSRSHERNQDSRPVPVAAIP